jgi:NADPH:quinone reductase-like Zn-dependent oxidoreductase
MSQQKVFRLPSKGAGYNAIEEKSEAIPKPAAHEVLLQVHATTLNYRDLAIAYVHPTSNIKTQRKG